MVSKASDCATKVKNFEGEQANEAFGSLSTRISQLKKQIQANRFASIKGKLRKNGKNLEINTSELVESATLKKDLLMQKNGSKNMLSLRSENPLCKLSGFAQGSGEKDNFNNQEVLPSTIIKLPYVEKIPPYTTWIFLDKNQRMAEDQSVVGRRQIYYDQYGSETLICSDSEEEFAEPEGKHEFSEGEDQMLWKVSQEHGLTQEVLKILSQFIEATSSEIQDRCNILVEKYQEKHSKKAEGSGEEESERSMFLDKSLNMALDSFDNLFCRRCLVFDCRLHGCSQSLVTPSEKQPYWFESEENGKPCGDQCYLMARKGIKEPSGRSDTSTLCRIGSVTKKDQNPLYSRSEEPTPDNLGTGISPDERCSGGRTGDISSEITIVPIVSAGAVNNDESISMVPSHENLGKRKVLKHVTITVENSKPGSDDFQDSAHKKQKKIAGVDVCYVSTEGQTDSDLILRENIRNPDSGAPNDNKQKKDKHVLNESVEYTKYIGPDSAACDENNDNIIEHETNDATEKGVMEQSSGLRKGQIKGVTSGCEWKPLEKELYLKGIEIFGRNSCLIARNLLSGLKTCFEVSMYMCNDGGEMAQRTSVPDSYLEDTGKADTDYMEQEMPTRTRLFRRRGRARKLKYTWKSAGHPSIRKRIADGKHQSCKQYTPCGCQFNCGKQCPCLRNGTCCEKYCGCSKGCKNRFRGCHCAKSQCRSRQCPCFAAGRECDPDVCRNCWISCGDGSLGEPPARGDGYQCGNMKLLLKQQQRILLAKSDVAGWGAFLKNPVNKNDYLGEYTGELISHREADKRGKIYDRANSSFLFDLNDQYVLDAYRKGDKLKFANHSSNPNCYAKVMLVAGDHRVGIFAKEHIEANEELFYDYRYCPDQAPVWARKPGSSKKDDSSVSNGRAQKHQSH